MVRRHQRVAGVIALIAAFALPAIVAVQSADDGRKHSARDWPAPGGDWGTSRYSTLRQITTGNAKTLGGAWVVELPERETSRSFPIVSDGLMFLTRIGDGFSRSIRPPVRQCGAIRIPATAAIAASGPARGSCSGAWAIPRCSPSIRRPVNSDGPPHAIRRCLRKA